MSTTTKSPRQDNGIQTTPTHTPTEQRSSTTFSGTRSKTPQTHAGHAATSRESASAKTHRTGITVIAYAQAAIAAVMISTFLAQGGVSALSPADAILHLLAPGLLLYAGVSLGMHRAGGWWCTSAVSYFVGLQSFATVVLGLSGVESFNLGLAAALFGTCVVMLFYLNRGSTMEAIAFNERTPAYMRSRVSPATVGFLFSLLFILIEIIGP